MSCYPNKSCYLFSNPLFIYFEIWVFAVGVAHVTSLCIFSWIKHLSMNIMTLNPPVIDNYHLSFVFFCFYKPLTSASVDSYIVAIKTSRVAGLFGHVCKLNTLLASFIYYAKNVSAVANCAFFPILTVCCRCLHVIIWWASGYPMSIQRAI